MYNLFKPDVMWRAWASEGLVTIVAALGDWRKHTCCQQNKCTGTIAHTY